MALDKEKLAAAIKMLKAVNDDEPHDYIGVPFGGEEEFIKVYGGKYEFSEIDDNCGMTIYTLKK